MAAGREALQDGGQPAVPGRAGLLGARHRLPLGEQQPVGAVQDQVDVGAAHLHAQRVDLGEVAGQARPAAVRGRRRPAAGRGRCRPPAGRRARRRSPTRRRPSRSGSVTASSTPCGWIAPGTAIGSSAQLQQRLLGRPGGGRHARATLRGVRGDADRDLGRPTRRWARSRRGRAGRRSAARAGWTAGRRRGVDAGGRGLAGRCARAPAHRRSPGTWWASDRRPAPPARRPARPSTAAPSWAPSPDPAHPVR